MVCYRWHWSCVLWDWSWYWQECLGSYWAFCSHRCTSTGRLGLILLATLLYRNQVKLWPCEPLSLIVWLSVTYLLSHRYYPPIYQPPGEVYLLNVVPRWTQLKSKAGCMTLPSGLIPGEIKGQIINCKWQMLTSCTIFTCIVFKCAL